MYSTFSPILNAPGRAALRWPGVCASLLGLVAATGFAPLGLWPLLLVALTLFLCLLAIAPNQRTAFHVGWMFGFGQFALGLNWIATAFTFQAAMPAWLGWVAVLGISACLALFPALASWGAWHIARAGTQRSALVLAFAAMWGVTEWLRSWLMTGFAWNPLGAALPVALAGPARLLGTYGLAMVIVAVAGVMVLLYDRRWAAATMLSVGIAGISAPDWLPLAGFAMPSIAAPATPGVAVTIVQPNVGQQDKWEGDKADANFAKLADLTIGRGAHGAVPRLILWPEAAVPDYLEDGYPAYFYDRDPANARARLAALMQPGDQMLLGALTLEQDDRGDVVGARNAVLAIGPDAMLGPRYAKAHLVPGGEYLPLRPLMSRIGLSRLVPGDLDFWSGPGPQTLELGKFGRVGIQVCYEIIFSGQVVDRANRPDFLFNPSNDAWFGRWGPPQHLAQARLRAIEEGQPVLRATPTGISAVIDADGVVRASLPIGGAGRIDALVPPAHAPTLFARFGHGGALALALILLAASLATRGRRR